MLLLEMTVTSRALAKAAVRHERALRTLDEVRERLVAIDDAAAEVPEAPESDLQLVTYEEEDEGKLVRTEIRPDEFRWAIGADILPLRRSALG